MKLVHIGRRPPKRKSWSDKPDWIQANPARIERALEQALSRNAGGWFVLGASRDLQGAPKKYQVLGQELVAYRASHGVVVAPATCPHMGADLCGGKVERDRIVCPWHGLSLGGDGHGTWKPFSAMDDGVLVWVQLENGEKKTDSPVLSARPDSYIAGVISVTATCGTEDVIANRLDPWHGVHYHGHSFAKLRVLELTDNAVTLRVSYRAFGPLAVEVDATFHSPNPRTITMTITDGEGTGSVVETHATPLGDNRTLIVEATLASSPRTGFRVARRAPALMRWFIEQRAERLWIEDAEYAERRFKVRTEKASARTPPRSMVRAGSK